MLHMFCVCVFFFSFHYLGTQYPCAVVHWFDHIGDSPDESTGMWIVRPGYQTRNVWNIAVVHINTIYHAAHLIPVYSAHSIDSRDFRPHQITTCSNPSMWINSLITTHLKLHSKLVTGSLLQPCRFREPAPSSSLLHLPQSSSVIFQPAHQHPSVTFMALVLLQWLKVCFPTMGSSGHPSVTFTTLVLQRLKVHFPMAVSSGQGPLSHVHGPCPPPMIEGVFSDHEVFRAPLGHVRGPRLPPMIEGTFSNYRVFRAPLSHVHGPHPPMIEGTFSDCGVFRAPLGHVHGSHPPPTTKGMFSVHWK